MSALVFDIECIGDNFDGYDSLTQSVLVKKLKKERLSQEEHEARIEEIKNSLALSPLTGQIVSIAMLHLPSQKSCVDFQAPGEKLNFSDERGTLYQSMDEKAMLEHFWQCTEKCTEFVTFFGRGFDIPYLMIRSAVHKIRPSKNLLFNRYLYSQKDSCRHIDLQDQLTFYGAWRGCSLHLCCNALGIKSPKSDEVDGSQVQDLFAEKKFKEIAQYNMEDVWATAELYHWWKEYLAF